MSCSIKLVRLDDFISDVDSIDLSTGGYSLATDGYFQSVAPIGAKSVNESITLKLKGTSKDNLATLTQDLDEKIKQVQWWLENPGIERYQVWLRVQLDNESYPRQAQVLNIKPPDKVKTFTIPEMNGNYIGEYQIGIERTPFWEDPYPYPTTTAKTGISTIGGTATLSETINGDVPARLARLSLYPPNSSNQQMDYWIGWKTNRFGVAANFVPVWPLHSSYFATADTNAAADGTAYDGTKITCTFASGATLLKRNVIMMGSIMGSNYADQRGSYTVLMRAKMSDSSVARVRIGYGFGNSITVYNPTYRSRQIISGTIWNLFEMGVIKIPPLRVYNANTLQNFEIEFDAERISGSGSLDMDCAILIPIDDGMVKISALASIMTQNTRKINVMQQSSDVITALVDDSDIVIHPVTPHPVNSWSLPANGDSPILVVAASDTDLNGNVKGKVTSMSYTYIPRWRTLRGSST